MNNYYKDMAARNRAVEYLESQGLDDIEGLYRTEVDTENFDGTTTVTFRANKAPEVRITTLVVTIPKVV